MIRRDYSDYTDTNLIRCACNSLFETKANLLFQFAVKSLVSAHQIPRIVLTSNLVSYSA